MSPVQTGTYVSGMDRPEWLPGLDAIRTAESSQEVVLLIQFYKHRQKGLLVSLGKPVIKTLPKRPKRPHLSLNLV